MKGEIVGYNAEEGTITIKLITIQDGDYIPLGRDVEILTKPDLVIQQEE